MKKVLVLAMTAIMVFTITACSNTSAQAADKTMDEIKAELRKQEIMTSLLLSSALTVRL